MCCYLLYNYLCDLSEIGEKDNYLELLELRRGLMRINKNLVRELREKRGYVLWEKGNRKSDKTIVRISKKT